MISKSVTLGVSSFHHFPALVTNKAFIFGGFMYLNEHSHATSKNKMQKRISEGEFEENSGLSQVLLSYLMSPQSSCLLVNSDILYLSFVHDGSVFML